MRIKQTIALGLATAAAATLALAGTASANDVTLYENSNYAGATVDVYGDVANFAGWTFSNGHAVKNNAAAAWNWGPGDASIYFNSNFGGNSDYIAAYSGRSRLGFTYNNNASLRFWG
ncbi:peptidase inhibitor family I36 protein [Kitasatospora sp. NPDC096147]|uniref:peptidase inhibitor family I36 protein n=1 Tax=Kitasatospora sp. NPDC096147 TaxID=3364093 RepID=UPI00380A53E0